jgi:predicted transcriptional regulator YdeE
MSSRFPTGLARIRVPTAPSLVPTDVSCLSGARDLTEVDSAAIVTTEASMDTRIAARGPLLLVGMSFYGNPFSNASGWDEDNEIGSLWRRFMAFLSASPSAIRDRADPAKRCYELHISAPETPKTGRYEVFAGIEVRSLASVPVLCSAKVLPAAEYAVLTVRGEEIVKDWMGQVYTEIVPSLGRRASEEFIFELYDERFKGMDKISESELDFYIPLLPREPT